MDKATLLKEVLIDFVKKRPQIDIWPRHSFGEGSYHSGLSCIIYKTVFAQEEQGDLAFQRGIWWVCREEQL